MYRVMHGYIGIIQGLYWGLGFPGITGTFLRAPVVRAMILLGLHSYLRKN